MYIARLKFNDKRPHGFCQLEFVKLISFMYFVIYDWKFKTKQNYRPRGVELIIDTATDDKWIFSLGFEKIPSIDVSFIKSMINYSVN